MKRSHIPPGAFSRHLARLALVLFSSILIARLLSSQSFAQLADPSSESALNTINSDLTQEILAGSSNVGTVASPVYLPSSNINMLPSLVGSTGTGGQENLLKVSIPAPFFSGSNYSTTGPSRASSALTTGTSTDGSFFTTALWNSPLFLPVTSGSDFTPLLTTGTFTPPNWILVAQDGSNPTTWSPALISSTNSTSVVSRYAYTLYHEGGLLDANVAGYPSTSTPTQVGYKPALPYADLTQIGLAPSQVDTIVGWRNYASTQAPGSLLSPNFTAASGSNYYQFVLSNTTGFLTPSTAVFNGETDQLFGSRQELINFMQSSVGLSGTSLDVLNYLSTFTRGLNQPSIAPDPTRPLIFSGAANNGGNNAYNLDNQINPIFPAVQVQTPFTRNDGTLAVVGEPLVKKRFALSKLAWITYLGPSANRVIPPATPVPAVTDVNYDMWQLVYTYGVPASYLAQGTRANIQKYFGLVWQVDTAPAGRSGAATSFHDGEYKWFYQGHNETGQSASGPSGSGVNIYGSAGSIARVEDLAIAANPREPDFFELLKAAVSAGSKAKSSMSQSSINATYSGQVEHPYLYQSKLDTDLDYAIIQLGANIIDQAKVDGYSTRIVFNDGTIEHEFRGVENLPYMYRFNSATLKLRMENPVLTGANNSELDSPPANGFRDPGVGLIMEVPTIWNPHDLNAPLGDPAPAGPGVAPGFVSGTNTNFRLIADSTYPDDLSAVTTINPAVYTAFTAEGNENQQNSVNGSTTTIANKTYTTGPNGTGPTIVPAMNQAFTPPQSSAADSLYPNNSALMFAVPNQMLFREPTPLAMSGYPAGSNLQMATPNSEFILIQNSAAQIAWASTGGTTGFLSDGANPLGLPNGAPLGASQRYVGICAALYPIQWPGVKLTTGTMGVYQSSTVTLNYSGGLTGGPYITYRLQYKDPNINASAYSGNDGSPTVDSVGILWETYDEKYNYIDCLFLGSPFGTHPGNLVDQANQFEGGGDWESYADPRTSRFAAINGVDLLAIVDPPAATGEIQEWADPANGVTVTDRPDINSGYAITDARYKGGSLIPGQYLSVAAQGWTFGQPYFHLGLLSQNSSSNLDNGIRFAGDSTLNNAGAEGPTYYSDPDGVVRGAMGIYQLGNSSAPATDTVGLPLATSYPAGYNVSTTGPYQAQSRPYILHRPFRSVAELGYVFSGTPWKNLDFFTPQSGDAGLLDVFTINETPDEITDPNQLVAGTVNLNTRQTPVLQALLSGAYTDEAFASGTANTNFSPITAAQANAILTNPSGLISRTTSTAVGEGPLQNISDLVGRWDSSLLSGTNYTFAYTGPSADLTNAYASAYSDPTTLQTMQNVDRFRESFIRPLATVGNTRIWNLMIDLVVQNGAYQPGATTLDNFTVTSAQRYWVHEAVDRYTGQILDQSVENVGPGPESVSLTASSITDNLPAGTTVASLSSFELSGAGHFKYTLVSGTGDNASFTISGNLLKSATVFDYLTKSTYNLLLTVTDQSGLTYTEPVTINIQPSPYTQWKITNFGSSANDPTIAGDMIDSQNDGLPNLLKYALGKSPNSPATTGITVSSDGTTLTMNYTRASAATDVTVNAAVGSDLTNPSSWTTSGVTQTMLSDNGTIQHWQATTPVNSSNSLFMQLTVTHP